MSVFLHRKKGRNSAAVAVQSSFSIVLPQGQYENVNIHIYSVITGNLSARKAELFSCLVVDIIDSLLHSYFIFK